MLGPASRRTGTTLQGSIGQRRWPGTNTRISKLQAGGDLTDQKLRDDAEQQYSTKYDDNQDPVVVESEVFDARTGEESPEKAAARRPLLGAESKRGSLRSLGQDVATVLPAVSER
jgi:hypothetical protein